ncbi:MAG: L,D-transpeptidase family protein [Epsilonproteobacteria bacterium]|nr:L,D-transpeptidase family protein [Campylobacterota bacterium]
MKIQLLILGAIGILLLNSCGEPVAYGKVDKTPYPTKECIKELSCSAELKGPQIDKIVVYKKKRKMYTYSNGKLMHEFRISLGKNADKGNKVKAGDYRTPEGSYKIVRKKCDNRLYKSLMISYPNAADKARAAKRGVSTGGYITIHGQPKWNADGRGDAYTLSRDWTEGCMAVPNKAMDALWHAVRNGVKIDIHA